MTARVVYEGMVPGGSSGGSDSTTFGGGYGSGPLVLPAGGYSVTAWLATYDGGVGARPAASAPPGHAPAARRRRAQRRLPTQQGVHLPAGALAVA